MTNHQCNHRIANRNHQCTLHQLRAPEMVQVNDTLDAALGVDDDEGGDLPLLEDVQRFGGERGRGRSRSGCGVITSPADRSRTFG